MVYRKGDLSVSERMTELRKKKEWGVERESMEGRARQLWR